MDSEKTTLAELSEVESALSGLQAALQRLTSPQVEPIQTDLEEIKNRINALQELLHTLESRLTKTSGTLQEDIDILLPQIQAFQVKISDLEHSLEDPGAISKRMSPVLIDVIGDRVNVEQDRFADAISPVMGQAIRSQIRNAREDIIDALYPVVGQIISKAIAEAIRELSRNIDHRLRRRLDLKSRWEGFLARIRGVSESDLFLRDSFGYNVHHIFLIHRETGLLLQHVASRESATDEFATMSGMLTAIRDFVKDSFGQGSGDLEEIAHGSQRILLASGRLAYIAVVMDGIEPTGYAALMDRIASGINIEHEITLRSFEGDQEALADFSDALSVLIRPGEDALDYEIEAPLSKGQRQLMAALVLAVVFVLAGSIFACVFTIRLWPYAFGAVVITPLPVVIATQTQPMPSPTKTATPKPTSTFMPSPTSTPTERPTATFTPDPTKTPTPMDTLSPQLPLGLLTGNVYIRTAPSDESISLGVLMVGETVEVLDEQESWVHIRWISDENTTIEGWVWGQFLTILPQP